MVPEFASHELQGKLIIYNVCTVLTGMSIVEIDSPSRSSVRDDLSTDVILNFERKGREGVVTVTFSAVDVNWGLAGAVGNRVQLTPLIRSCNR
jgi:hypothetical protein